MNILDQIQVNFQNFFESEKKIAEFILKNPKKVIDMPIALLARNSNVSEASISRFCKKLNLTGFHQLKIELARIQDNENIKVNKNTSLNELIKNISKIKTTELIAATDNLDIDNLQSIIKIITNVKLTHFVASGNTIPVAKDASYRFNQLGITSVVFDDWQVQTAFTLNMRKEDLLIVISNSGESKSLIKLINIAKEKKIPTISITNHPDSPIARLSNFHLTSFSRDYFFHNDYYFSRLSAMYLIELIFLILSQDKSRLENIKLHEQIISEAKL